jgi:signal transduction histidine kinase
MGFMMVLVNIGVALFVFSVLPHVKGADDEILPAIIKGSLLGANITLTETPELLATVKEFPAFWFVATMDGHQTTFGEIPDEYRALLPALKNIMYADIRADENSRYTATTTDIETGAGKVRLFYGGRSEAGSLVLNMIWYLKVIYIPFTVVPLLVVFIVIPIIVRKALSGIKATTAKAATIDATTLGVRLPSAGVVDEIKPLVTAINLALTRIDEDVARRARFLADAAHELKTPIAILQTRLEVFSPGDDKTRLLLDVARLGATAEQLLDIQRFASIQSWEVVDVVSLCETVAADLAPLAIAGGYELEFETEVSSFTITGDYSSLERAVTNLVRNAIEHSGGHGRIRIEVSKNGVIEVSDEGQGIPVEEREKVFEPFYRVKPKPTGAGLGLSLVRQIAKTHCGHVTLLDCRHGTRFRLTLGSAH